MIVDDRPAEARPLVLALGKSVKATVLHPGEIDREDLRRAQLVLVDWKLDHWSERDDVDQIALQPANGIALAAVLREQSALVRQAPTAFALYSGKLSEISPHFPVNTREHAIARAHNLEWVFPKASNTGPQLATRVASLAHAVARLPRKWPELATDKGATALALLALDMQKPWAHDAWAAVEECHPPLHQLSQASHGISYIRWFAQRVLPYPCFLWDQRWLALRFFSTQASLRQALGDSRKFVRSLDPFLYRGVLESFDDRRWWKAGIESFLWGLTSGEPFNAQLIRKRLAERCEVNLEPLNASDPVACVDVDLKTLDRFASIASSVRVQPDDWPPYADQAWTTLRLAASHPALGTIVVADDRAKLRAWKRAQGVR